MRLIISRLLGYVLIGLTFFCMFISLKANSNFLDITKSDFTILLSDLLYSFIRVFISVIISCVLGIIVGKFLHQSLTMRNLILPLVNFMRHISPFAWIPFGIIWFGLGEQTLGFVMFITLFFPIVIMSLEIFSGIPKEFIDESRVLGADKLKLFFYIELPILRSEFLNLFRVIWGLSWTAIIAVEMLGVRDGLGFRLLDFRYLLKYNKMLLYLLVLGIVGVIVDLLMKKLVDNVKH